MADFSLYTQYGLTAQSNNPDIVKRDSNGNVVVYSGNDDNQKLFIETVKERYTNRSVINTIDTQFRYFTFPVADTGVTVSAQINLPDIPPIELPDTETGEIPPVTFDRDRDRVPDFFIRSNIQTLFDRQPAVLQTNRVDVLFNNFRDAVLEADDEYSSTRQGPTGYTRSEWETVFSRVSSGNRTQDLNYILVATIDNLVAGGDGIIE
jgi:hypothetical protein